MDDDALQCWPFSYVELNLVGIFKKIVECSSLDAYYAPYGTRSCLLVSTSADGG